MPFETRTGVTATKPIPQEVSHAEQLRLIGEILLEIQERLNKLDDQVDSLARNAARNAQAMRAETRTMIDGAIRESERAYRGWRVIGFVLVLAGATIVWSASVW